MSIRRSPSSLGTRRRRGRTPALGRAGSRARTRPTRRARTARGRRATVRLRLRRRLRSRWLSCMLRPTFPRRLGCLRPGAERYQRFERGRAHDSGREPGRDGGIERCEGWDRGWGCDHDRARGERRDAWFVWFAVLGSDDGGWCFRRELRGGLGNGERAAERPWRGVAWDSGFDGSRSRVG